MSVMKDPSGRRWVQVEVEVPGTPEEVCRAIASGPGVSSWFVPTTVETDKDGKPVRVLSNFGPGMESVATVTSWNPPHTFRAESADLGPDAPKIATEWNVEARAGGRSVVRVVHSLFARTDEWDNQLEGWEHGWPDFFRLLRLYLTHFPGLPCSAFQVMGAAPEPKSEAWVAWTTALGLSPVAVGERCRTADGVPQLGGIVERVGEGENPEELLLRLDQPTPGLAHLFAMPMGGQVFLSLRIYLYGDRAAAAAASDEPRWQAWISERFPPSDDLTAN